MSTQLKKIELEVVENTVIAKKLLKDQVLPHSPRVETAIIGAVLFSKDAFMQINTMIESDKYFYIEQCQIIYKHCVRLHKRNKVIDIITVGESLKEKKELGKIGGHAALIAFTEQTGSVAHLEYHAEILREYYQKRFLLIQAAEMWDKGFQPGVNAGDLLDQYSSRLKLQQGYDMFEVEYMADTIAKGLEEEPAKQIAGSLVKEKDLVILFGDTGAGKSVLAYQIANEAADGKDFLNMYGDNFKNQCEPKSTYYICFELQKAEVAERYSNDGVAIKVSENLKRVSIKDDFLDLGNFANKVISEIERLVAVEKPDLLFIDNISWILSESTDSTLADKLMKRLWTLQKLNPPLSIVVIAHTPKRNNSLSMEKKDLAGSSVLANYAKSLVGLSLSKKDSNIRYIKHIKCRNGRNNFDHESVIEVEISKEQGNLSFKYVGLGPEDLHLEVAEDMDQLIDEWKHEAIDLVVKQGKSYREATNLMRANHSQFSKSYGTIARWVKQYRDQNGKFII